MKDLYWYRVSEAWNNKYSIVICIFYKILCRVKNGKYINIVNISVFKQKFNIDQTGSVTHRMHKIFIYLLRKLHIESVLRQIYGNI